MKLNGTASGSLEALLEAASLGSAAWPRLYPTLNPFGYFCSYWPEELVLSVGWEPLRIWAPTETRPPMRLPSYCCLPARACLAAAEAKIFDFLVGVGFAHSCDTMQCLAGIWPHQKTFLLIPPVPLEAPEAKDYFIAELDRIWRSLAVAAHTKPDESELRRAVALMNRIRSLVGELDDLRPHLPSHFVASLLRAGQIMPRTIFAERLAEALPVLREKTGKTVATGKRRRILISGSPLESDGLFTMLEELDARVVAEDTCTGFRHYDGIVDEQADPLAGIADRLASRVPCACRHRHLSARPDHILALAEKRQAQGVILVVRKYCEPYAWDAMAVSEALRLAGIPVLVLEMETNIPGGQERTRIQAFLECLPEYDQEDSENA